jgi:hypothetical protein
VNEAFRQEHGTSYEEYAQQQRANALQIEQNLPLVAAERLDTARNSALERIKAYADGLAPEDARQIAVFEAPLRVSLNPELTNPENWSRLAPPSTPEETGSTPGAGSDPYTPPQTTFAPVGSPTWLRQQLEAERQRAISIDNQNEALLWMEVPVRAAIVGAKGVLVGAGYVRGGEAGAGYASIVYDSATALPFIISGQETVESSAQEIGTTIGVPAAGDVGYSAFRHTVDWISQYRMLQATRTR